MMKKKEENQNNNKKKVIYFLFPIFVVVTIIELVFLLNTGTCNKELNGNSNEIKSIKEPNYDEEMTLGDILYNSTDVSYNNANSGLTSTNVKAAIDELYQMASTWINPNNNFGTPQYYAFGKYKGWCSSTDTKCNSYSDFPTTSTTPPSGKNVYAAIYADGEYGLCIKRNGIEHCFRGRNWIAEAQHMQKVFSGANDSYNFATTYINFFGSDFECSVNAKGRVYCGDLGTDALCLLDSTGYVDCRE